MTTLLIGALIAGAVGLVLATRRRQPKPGSRVIPAPESHGRLLLGEKATERVRALLDAGQLIEAIKEYRALTGAGLHEAKDAVERMKKK